MTIDDATLVKRFKEGDEDAFRRITEKHYNKIFSMVFGMVRNREDALDVTQDVFVKVYKNLHRFKGESKLYTWIFRIAMNRAIDFQRRASRREQTYEYDDRLAVDNPGEATSDLLPSRTGEDPRKQLAKQELGRVLQEAMGKLGQKHREVIVLRELEGLSYDEIATTVGCSIGTVMSRLHHARKKLQKHLKGYLG